MKPIDIIVIIVIAVVIGCAVAYIIKAKKSGKKCIGCPDSGSCGKSCFGCTCGCGENGAKHSERSKGCPDCTSSAAEEDDKK